ncbi:MAG TPA: hypothetical protein VJL35_11055 [Gemmatimonadaceae bacterium]|nr:hypothetical protein [Gemmatimonadaceae bacterium]
MTAAGLRRDPGNAVVAVADFARSLSLELLVALETIGLVSSLAIYAASPRRWPFTLPCIALTCFALWGIIDHWITRLTSHRQKKQRRILRITARFIAVLGVLAALLSAYALIGWMMGVYIS